MSFDKNAKDAVNNYQQLICEVTGQEIDAFLANGNFKKNHLTMGEIAEKLAEQTGIHEQIVRAIVTLYTQERKDVEVIVGRYGGIRPVGLKAAALAAREALEAATAKLDPASMSQPATTPVSEDQTDS